MSCHDLFDRLHKLFLSRAALIVLFFIPATSCFGTSHFDFHNSCRSHQAQNNIDCKFDPKRNCTTRCHQNGMYTKKAGQAFTTDIPLQLDTRDQLQDQAQDQQLFLMTTMVTGRTGSWVSSTWLWSLPKLRRRGLEESSCQTTIHWGLWTQPERSRRGGCWKGNQANADRGTWSWAALSASTDFMASRKHHEFNKEGSRYLYDVGYAHEVLQVLWASPLGMETTYGHTCNVLDYSLARPPWWLMASWAPLPLLRASTADAIYSVHSFYLYRASYVLAWATITSLR